MKKIFTPGDIVQITGKKHKWFSCLVIVEEIKAFGIQGYTTIPLSGPAYIRLKNEDIKFVGKAEIINFEPEKST